MDKDNKVAVDLSYLKEVASDNIEFMVEMIDIFLAQTPDYVSILSNAVSDENWSKIAEMSHKIKPTLAFMGANEAKETMATIESRAREKDDYQGIVVDFGKLKEDFNLIFSGLQEKRKELLASS
ncbi:Hpt domain-containing protein [Pedobacter arcticus]|uniref:Hpt domain-containing protein n=1 Tax=Pedobacter arcticus TaxID=752140 RepID=UPI0002D9BCDA|nr:Hpt domain-containing protein [Pedobacter arcticus]